MLGRLGVLEFHRHVAASPRAQFLADGKLWSAGESEMADEQIGSALPRRSLRRRGKRSIAEKSPAAPSAATASHYPRAMRRVSVATLCLACAWAKPLAPVPAAALSDDQRALLRRLASRRLEHEEWHTVQSPPPPKAAPPPPKRSPPPPKRSPPPPKRSPPPPKRCLLYTSPSPRD